MGISQSRPRRRSQPHRKCQDCEVDLIPADANFCFYCGAAQHEGYSAHQIEGVETDPTKALCPCSEGSEFRSTFEEPNALYKMNSNRSSNSRKEKIISKKDPLWKVKAKHRRMSSNGKYTDFWEETIRKGEPSPNSHTLSTVKEGETFHVRVMSYIGNTIRSCRNYGEPSVSFTPKMTDNNNTANKYLSPLDSTSRSCSRSVHRDYSPDVADRLHADVIVNDRLRAEKAFKKCIKRQRRFKQSNPSDLRFRIKQAALRQKIFEARNTPGTLLPSKKDYKSLFLSQNRGASIIE